MLHTDGFKRAKQNPAACNLQCYTECHHYHTCIQTNHIFSTVLIFNSSWYKKTHLRNLASGNPQQCSSSTILCTAKTSLQSGPLTITVTCTTASCSKPLSQHQDWFLPQEGGTLHPQFLNSFQPGDQNSGGTRTHAVHEAHGAAATGAPQVPC